MSNTNYIATLLDLKAPYLTFTEATDKLYRVASIGCL